jgi:hypothetical protein
MFRQTLASAIVIRPTTLTRPKGVGTDMPKRHAHGDEDQPEFADLRHRQDAAPLTVAHRAHDRQHDWRVLDQDEEGEDRGGGRVGVEQREVELDARDEDEDPSVFSR